MNYFYFEKLLSEENEQVEELKNIPGIVGVSPGYEIGGEAFWGKRQGYFSLIGLDPSQMKNFEFDIMNSFNNFYETKTFIDEMVKPDYNNWEGKDDYANRFMEIVEKKFF